MAESTDTPGQDLIQALKLSRPDIAISVTRSRDESFRWDGDGPDPEDEGYVAYDIDVTAITIRSGEILEGRDSLGGSYWSPDDPIGEVGGYLQDMVETAVEELDQAIARLDAATAHNAACDVTAADLIGMTHCPNCGKPL